MRDPLFKIAFAIALAQSFGWMPTKGTMPANQDFHRSGPLPKAPLRSLPRLYWTAKLAAKSPDFGNGLRL
jgi:hypothetical protein